MRLLLTTILHGLRPASLVLKIDCIIYRWARLLCGWFEEMSPEISQRAGFIYDLGWMTYLEDPDATEGLE